MAAQAALECADSARAQRNYLMVLLGVVNCALLTAFLSLNAYGGQHLWSQLSSGILHHVGLQPPKMPWAPLLTGEEQGKGVSHYGGGARLRAVAAKLLAGQPVKAFTLGGSVTYGHGVDDLSLAYSSLFFRYLNETFPHSGHKLVNWGLPGSTSPVTTPCVHSMVDQDADLAVVEFTANDSPSAWTSRGKKGFESLLRTLLALPGQPAVVLLHHYPWFKATGDGANAGLFYREPEGQLTTFSQYYDLPSLSLRSAAWRLMQAGIDGFRVDRVILEGSRDASTGEPIPAAEPGTEASFMYLDTIHPGPSGHQVLAELLVGLMERAVGEVVMNAEPTTRQDARLQGLPPPMIPNHQDSWPTFCAQLEDFEPMVAQQRGFQYAPEKPLLPRLEEQKWGWAAVDPGAWAELELDTTLQPERLPPGVDSSMAATAVASVQLAHLRSYAGMGTALVECMSGCACKPSLLDGTSASRASVFKVHAFKASQHPRCHVRVTVSDEPGATPQEGHKVMLAAVMVVHSPAEE